VDDGVETLDRLAAGRILGERYQMRERLGQGGMGEVWRAFDLKLRLDVALTAVRPDKAANERARELLRQEVRSAREVVSPNVCRIFDLVVEDGQELVSMELIDGATLTETLRVRGPLPLQEAREIASQFLAGLEAIHQAGLVHRDFKPENVMLTRAGETGPSLKGHARSGGRAELAVYEASRSDQVHLALVVSPATGVPARWWKTPVAARWSPSAVAHTRTGWRRSGQDGRRQADPPRRGRQPRPRRRHAGAIPVLSRVPLPKRLSWTPPTRAGTRLYLRDRVETLALDPGAVEPSQRRKPPIR
jgi:serine/threonine protein kinase